MAKELSGRAEVTGARAWPRALGRKIVGQDSNLVIECHTNDYIGILSQIVPKEKSIEKSGSKTRSGCCIPAWVWQQADQAEGAASSVWVGTTQSLTSVLMSWARWTLMV